MDLYGITLAHLTSNIAFIVRESIVTERTKAPILVYKSFMMYSMILEGVPSKTTHTVLITAGIWLP